jgi:ribosomal protein S18 acetylase RimI-like enzyme
MGRLDTVAVGDRLRYLEVLLLADDAGDRVRARLDDGDLFVWIDDLDGEPVGAVQALARTPSLWELVLVAVRAEHQGRGHGTAMVDAVIDRLAGRGARRIVVGTATAGVGQLAFYQRAGFRVFAVERDHFDADRGYDGTETEHGIAIRDLVWLDRLIR